MTTTQERVRLHRERRKAGVTIPKKPKFTKSNENPFNKFKCCKCKTKATSILRTKYYCCECYNYYYNYYRRLRNEK